jgi:hypothetical protein
VTMSFRVVLLAAALAVLAMPAAASADVTLGLSTQPASSSPNACGSNTYIYGENTSDTSTPYAVPSGDAGFLKSWTMDTAGDEGGTVTLYVIAPTSTVGVYTLIGTDTQTLTTPIATTTTFTPTSKIDLQPGDTFALGSASGSIACYFGSGDTPSGDTLFMADTPTTNTSGQTLTSFDPSPAGYALDLSVDVSPFVQDAGVTAAAGPAAVAVGSDAILSADVTNHGPGFAPITFTDVVPSGLRIDAVAGGENACTTTGQTVSCTIANLAVGDSQPVDVVVTPTTAKTYSNTVTVANPSAITDPVTTNNSATATLSVKAAAPAPKCVVVSLKGVPQSVAEKVLKALDCKVGKVKKATSKSVAKGDVISTSPGAGSYAVDKNVGLTVSSGKPKPKKKHKKK